MPQFVDYNVDMMNVSIGKTINVDITNICKALGKLRVVIPDTQVYLASSIASDTRKDAYRKYFSNRYTNGGYTLGLETSTNYTRPKGYWYVYKKNKDGHVKGEKEWRAWQGTKGAWKSDWYKPKHTRQTNAGLVDHLGRRLVGFSLAKIDANTRVAYFASYPVNLYENDVTYMAFGKYPVKRQGIRIFQNNSYLPTDILGNYNEKNKQKFVNKVMNKAQDLGLQVD